MAGRNAKGRIDGRLSTFAVLLTFIGAALLLDACGPGAAGSGDQEMDLASIGQAVEGDNDDDGIADEFDLDDDNDGILDTVECPTQTLAGADFWVTFNPNYDDSGYESAYQGSDSVTALPTLAASRTFFSDSLLVAANLGF